MSALYEISAEAQNDLFEIWRRIAIDSVELANRTKMSSMPCLRLSPERQDRGMYGAI